MDVVSQVLKGIKLDGALFYNAEFTSPWSMLSPPSNRLVSYLAPAAEHLIVYHFVIEGRGVARLLNGASLPFEAGDIVIFPHGHSHILENGPAAETVDGAKELAKIIAQGLSLARMGGGGEVTRFVCGYMACDMRLCQVVLSGLPPLFKVNVRDDHSGRWLADSIRFAVDGANSDRAGSHAVLARLSEVMFIETLRHYLTQLPSDHTGWLAGARDPAVGKALASIHRDPARPWRIADLAREAGVSRSVLAERFTHYLGEPPMAYLTRWRLRLGAVMLGSTDDGVAQVAAEVGYQSEAAFNRAFKREFQTPPARFRAQARARQARPVGVTGEVLVAGGEEAPPRRVGGAATRRAARGETG